MTRDTRLDRIARLVADDQISRRAALGRGARLAFGATLTSPLWGVEVAGAKVTKKKCKPGHVSCNGGCCPPHEKCVTPPPTNGKKHAPRCECVKPNKKCGTSCVAVQSDPHHCGACGHKCASGQVCSKGVCESHCTAGQTACSGACVTLATDPHNCGICGHACAAGQVCSNGVCQSQCASGQTACSGMCVTLASDPHNCGACGHACGTGETCTNSACVTLCPAGHCRDSTGQCVPGSDPYTCGSGGACVNCSNSPAGIQCVNGACGCLANTDCEKTTVNGGCCKSGSCLQGTADDACGNAFSPAGICVNCGLAGTNVRCLGSGNCGCITFRDCGPHQICSPGNNPPYTNFCTAGCSADVSCPIGQCCNGSTCVDTCPVPHTCNNLGFCV